MKYDDALFRYFNKALSIFERSKTKNELKSLSHYPLLLLGYSEGGFGFVETFRQMKKKYIVIDYDPDIIESLERRHINHLYGDVTDIELLEEIGVHKSEIVVSTINNAITNKTLASHIAKVNPGAVFICHASTFEEAEILYELGAAYVLMPHYIGDEHINHFLKLHGSNKKAFSLRHITRQLASQ
jgi:voltage-gated potassium channel Kch